MRFSFVGNYVDSSIYWLRMPLRYSSASAMKVAYGIDVNDSKHELVVLEENFITPVVSTLVIQVPTNVLHRLCIPCTQIVQYKPIQQRPVV